VQVDKPMANKKPLYKGEGFSPLRVSSRVLLPVDPTIPKNVPITSFTHGGFISTS